jgi:hypothetical protein
MYFKRFGVILFICGIVSFMAINASQNTSSLSFHSEQELSIFRKLASGPIGPGDYFLTAQHCESCHGYDSLNYANIDTNGVDINLYDDWKSTLMANSAKDPFWRAKVSHEILVNPSHTLELQDNCTSCHAPMGNYTSKYKGLASHYTMGALANDSLGLDGVSCVSCHAIADSARLGSVFSGTIPYDTTRNIYGPFTFPMAGPMQIPTGYAPIYSTHISSSKSCSPCHTLINKTVDLNGIYTGASFVEQATYQEWNNSIYSINNTTCQKCHMPRINSGVVIANDNQSIPYRSPYSQHIFVGGNTLMLKLLKQNKSQLNISIADRFFDSTIAASNDLLKKNTLDMELTQDSMHWDTAYFSVSLLNKAGHKFPSGYPSRRAVLQFIVTNSLNDTVFKSGLFHSNYSVSGESSNFESHQNYIRQNNQTQIYELVMGDVNQQPTTVAERAAFLLKDNRLPPQGFVSTHLSYDTAKISMDAFLDPDFNKTNFVEGSGKDIVHFNVPVSGLSGNLKAVVRLYYQAVPPKWLNEMFSFSSTEINTFKAQFNAADQTPILLASDSVNAIATDRNKAENLNSTTQIWPVISDGKVFLKSHENNFIQSIDVFSLAGKLLTIVELNQASNSYTLDLPTNSGMYIVRVKTKLHTTSKKIYRQ